MDQAPAIGKSNSIPAALLVGVLAAILFMALFALEVSDGFVRKNGTIAKSLFVFPLLLALFWGMLTRRRWALWFARLAAAIGSFWFYGWAVAAAVIRPTDSYGPVWIWILAVSIILGSVALTAFFALGRISLKKHYRMVCPKCQSAAAGAAAYFSSELACRKCGEKWTTSPSTLSPCQPQV